jgi:phenylpropionate dioxygenase-like ring-hydroxylating dioxygenase large terminal subunit
MDATTGPPRYLLAPEAYWSQESFDDEQRHLFARTWHLVADASELTEPGDYVTFSAGTDPMVVVHGLDGELRAFHNFCRHRGMLLLEGSGNTRPGISCPYHLWNFALDGDLRKIPQQTEQFCHMDAADWGLLAGSVATWGGLVFAHPDPGADLSAWLGDLPTAIGSVRPDRLTEVAHVRIDADCNWKLFVENHVDVLHLWYLHSGTLGDYDHPRFEWQQLGRNWVSYEPLRDDVEESRLATHTTTIRHLDERDLVGVGAHAAFPNVLMANTSEYFITYVATPVGPERMVVDLRIRSEPEVAAQDGAADALVAAVQAFILEDVAGCEGVQATLRSSRFSVGPLAMEHERPIMLFQQHVLDALAAGRAGRP